ncbi:MAG: phytanoyl-CoA dioxygenase family protein, partial [Myxococcota bacterium]|nr:phytanoyl-CoA dioxygenase family protein [Myxococcota bacterium]
ESILPAFIQTEDRIAAGTERLEDRVSKVFRIHRELSAFHDFARDPLLGNMLADLLGPDIDCFLSQFIFKLPGALGQPWHQDAYYFHFDRGPQVGVWLAVTEAHKDNGPLSILSASHTEPVHEAVADRREHANLGYVEIVDHDTSAEEVVLMDPGDLLVFHSHLLHRSSDNASSQMRAAMVYHFASAATRDLSKEKIGFIPPNTDWMPVRREEEFPRKTDED